jgi:hypothetical protein
VDRPAVTLGAIRAETLEETQVAIQVPLQTAILAG